MGIDFNYFGLNRHLKMDMDFTGHAPVVKRVDNSIQGIKCIGWSTFYLLDSHLLAIWNCLLL